MNKSFKRPGFSATATGTQSVNHKLFDEIDGLPDLVKYNARENPTHLFCLQAKSRHEDHDAPSREPGYSACRLTFAELERSVNACAHRLGEVLGIEASGDQVQDERPVALYMESDLGLFLHLVALLGSDIPVCCHISLCI